MIRHLTILLALGAAACTPGEDVAFDNGFGMGDGTVEARLSGDMPFTGTFDDDSRSGWHHDYEGWVDMGVESFGDYGWAMLLVSGDEDGDLDVIGCSGEEDGDAEFDEPAEEADVDFEDIEIDGEPATAVRIRATFADGSQASAVGHIFR